MSEFNLSYSFYLMLFVALFTLSLSLAEDNSRRARAQEIGIKVGVMETGHWNAITDVDGVKVGHKTIISGDSIRTGVTAILPHSGNLFQEKVPAAIVVGNGFGKLAGYTQVEELGNIETPIVLTNTLSVGTALTAVVSWTLGQQGNENIRSVNGIVAETNDGYLNDIRGFHVSVEDVFESILAAKSGPVKEGSVGAGTGTKAFGFKGGIGTASRVIPGVEGNKYVLGVLVQSNYGGMLDINGAPVGRELEPKSMEGKKNQKEEGSCVIVVATDAPLSTRNLKRLAKRTFHGLARTGSFMSNGSGDYAIAFSTAYRIPQDSNHLLSIPPLLPNDVMTPFFQAVIEATQEAVYNSLFMATTIKGQKGRIVPAIPIDQVVEICKKYGVIEIQKK